MALCQHSLTQVSFIFSMDHKQNTNVVDETLMHYHNEDLERKKLVAECYSSGGAWKVPTLLVKPFHNYF